ncbi:GtrA family protein [Helicobacter labetoulli]|uniref:GtrA family protein n=1 Tax=Helicobacter labetoulli TaxID=2315333 RepID=UPI000EF71AE8|nr:GtrA family protein [Helicobacter labetoulli]
MPSHNSQKQDSINPHNTNSAFTRAFYTSFFTKLYKYILVGGSAALINWLIFYITIKFGLWYITAGFISFILATLWNFLFARIFIFKHSTHHLFKESVLIYLVSFCGLLIDMGVLFVCVEILNFHTMLGKIIATGIAFIFNFSVRFFGIYKE